MEADPKQNNKKICPSHPSIKPGERGKTIPKKGQLHRRKPQWVICNTAASRNKTGSSRDETTDISQAKRHETEPDHRCYQAHNVNYGPYHVIKNRRITLGRLLLRIYMANRLTRSCFRACGDCCINLQCSIRICHNITFLIFTRVCYC